MRKTQNIGFQSPICVRPPAGLLGQLLRTQVPRLERTAAAHLLAAQLTSLPHKAVLQSLW